MSLDVLIDRSKGDVTSAIYEFAARRGLAATSPWYLDGIRLEDTRVAPPAPAQGSTFWGSISAAFSPSPATPVVSIEFGRKRKMTRVVMSLGSHSGSIALAQTLRTYLLDDRAYTVQTPLTCSRCSAQINHFIARFCGRCGLPLGNSMTPVHSPHVPMALPPAQTPREWARLPDIPPPAALPAASPEPTVFVEREVVVTPEASKEPPEVEEAPAVAEPTGTPETAEAAETASPETPAEAPPEPDEPAPRRERPKRAEPAAEAD